MEFVSKPEQLARAVEDLKQASTYFIDTEFDSSKQGKRLSLIQISKGSTPYLIDALVLADLSPLSEAICRVDAQWVLHAGLQDIELLTARFGNRPEPKFFDTQVVWGLVGAEATVSLSFLQYRLLAIRAGKGYQADDWLRRPLPEAQLRYAAADIEHLPALTEELYQIARDQGKSDLVHEVSRELLFPRPLAQASLRFNSFRNAWQLDARGQQALRQLIDWHNGLNDGEGGLAPRTLLAIAGRLPASKGDLSRIKGVSQMALKRHGGSILSRLDEVRNLAVDESELEPPAYASFEQNLLEARLQLIRAELCAEQSIAPEIALPMALVRKMLQCASDAGGLQSATEPLEGWRDRRFSAAIQARARELESPRH